MTNEKQEPIARFCYSEEDLRRATDGENRIHCYCAMITVCRF